MLLLQIKGGKTLVATDDTEAEDVDAIIFSTGFDLTGAITSVDVRGLHGQGLAKTWLSQGPKSYYGIAAAGFPNLFILMGPNTGLGHNSVVYMIECQVAYVVKCLQWMQKAGLEWLEVKEQAQERFFGRLQENLKRTVWLGGGCKSWYLDGMGGSFVLWSGLCLSYWWQTLWVKKADWNAVKAVEEKEKKG
jgi:cation diffusion facilitator CzcD-associated flavoprotein CzcO